LRGIVTHRRASVQPERRRARADDCSNGELGRILDQDRDRFPRLASTMKAARTDQTGDAP
jgi:hypothetical protein